MATRVARILKIVATGGKAVSHSGSPVETPVQWRGSSACRYVVCRTVGISIQRWTDKMQRKTCYFTTQTVRTPSGLPSPLEVFAGFFCGSLEEK